MNVFLSPHNDDETLFGAFTILRESPLVVVVFRADPRSGDPRARQAETETALLQLGDHAFEQWEIAQEPADARRVSPYKLMELGRAFKELDAREHPARVWAPAVSPCGNAEHEAVGRVADAIFRDRVTHYHTYADGKKVEAGRQVPYEPDWIRLKLLALSSYRTQFPKAGRHFTERLTEWYA